MLLLLRLSEIPESVCNRQLLHGLRLALGEE